MWQRLILYDWNLILISVFLLRVLMVSGSVFSQEFKLNSNFTSIKVRIWSSSHNTDTPYPSLLRDPLLTIRAHLIRPYSGVLFSQSRHTLSVLTPGSSSHNTDTPYTSLLRDPFFSGNRNKGKGNGAGPAWESQSRCFADKFGKPYTHSFGTDTQHDYSQRNCRTMLSIIIKLE